MEGNGREIGGVVFYQVRGVVSDRSVEIVKW